MHAGEHDGTELTDDQLRARTEVLLQAAEKVSLDLRLQTERLQAAIMMYDRDVLGPLRTALGKDSE